MGGKREENIRRGWKRKFLYVDNFSLMDVIKGGSWELMRVEKKKKNEIEKFLSRYFFYGFFRRKFFLEIFP
jgi:hypothetical protein